MLILLEGCDGAGKSTLARDLQNAIGPDAKILHRGPLVGSAIDAYERDLDDYEPGSGQHIICDRWHLGEAVYGPILRGQSRMTASDQKHIEQFLKRRGAMAVHVTATTADLERRLIERGDDLITVDMLTDIVAAYGKAMDESSLAWWYADTTLTELFEIEQIIRAAKRYEDRAGRSFCSQDEDACPA